MPEIALQPPGLQKQALAAFGTLYDIVGFSRLRRGILRPQSPKFNPAR